MDVLARASTSHGRKLKVERVLASRKQYLKRNSDSFAASYLNVCIANGAVIGSVFGVRCSVFGVRCSVFGDGERDELAAKALANSFPGRKSILLPIDVIAAGGGGGHRLTQPMPRSMHSYGKSGEQPVWSRTSRN
ncbi:agmatine deiminase family protein [Bradyrhizobium diazoefficiens]|uniref:agmatine deiminase family protein n=1 Tax=Bradyrhizobium diazoefficiens TaxID=1355477 RepID=UPI0016046CBF|nr:agmatine deiminase family protein [Bradyrhizobium diazoefficiens]